MASYPQHHSQNHISTASICSIRDRPDAAHTGSIPEQRQCTGCNQQESFQGE